VAAVNNTAVVAAKIILFEFIANRSIFQSTQKPQPIHIQVLQSAKVRHSLEFCLALCSEPNV
jgi:hypothetical protein